MAGFGTLSCGRAMDFRKKIRDHWSRPSPHSDEKLEAQKGEATCPRTHVCLITRKDL